MPVPDGGPETVGEIIDMRMCKGWSQALSIDDFLGYVMNPDEVLKTLSMAG